MIPFDGDKGMALIFLPCTVALTLKGVNAYFEGLEAECSRYGDESFVIPQVGLSMTSNGQVCTISYGNLDIDIFGNLDGWGDGWA